MDRERVHDGSTESRDRKSFCHQVRVRDRRVSSNTSYNTISNSVVTDMSKYKASISMKVLSAQYESLDYDVCENSQFILEEKNTSSKSVLKKEIARWFVMFLIGVSTGLVACTITILVQLVSQAKFSVVQTYINTCVQNDCLYQPLLILASFNMAIVLVSALLTVYIAPVAAGSGIPQIKCFLNGVKIPQVVRFKTLFTKVVGVIGAVGGGLCVGKEGPMIHSGAVLAAGISQGRVVSLNLDFKIFDYFRSDTEKRDFVAGGAAAGVAAAFGAPIGGVLFSLEEGASFWNQALVWRIFFASMVSTFTLNVVMSYFNERPWDLTSPGLINFGKFDAHYTGVEIPLFMIMGVIGGLLGALFNHINYKLSVFRKKYLWRRWAQVLEAILVACITATSSFIAIYYNNVCKRPTKACSYPVQFFCKDGFYSFMAKLFFQTPEDSVRELFHDQPGTYVPAALSIYMVLYFLLACWTYGLSVPSGLFIPSLLVGATWGRLIGIFIMHYLPNHGFSDPSIYALIGAAAQLGGVVRMTISLTVIIIEATSSVTIGFPVMVVLIISKWIGDFFNEGLYDIHIQLQGVPLLGWEPPEMTSDIPATEVMSYPVTVMRTTEKVSRIIEILSNDTYNGFPVVEDYNYNIEQSYSNPQSFGIYRGVILRTQLIVLLKYKIFNEIEDFLKRKAELTSRHFRDVYPRYPAVQQIHVSQREREFTIDLTPYMNPASYTVESTASLPRIFRLFRALGMRHIIVLNKQHRVVGIVTRKDLARYHVFRHRGHVSMERLLISNS